MNPIETVYTSNLMTTTTDHVSCERIRGYLNSRNFNLILLETNHDISQHLQSCNMCSKAVNARKQVQQFLRGRLL
jgi:hypothetical protein